jgi:hypothetical protein
VDWIAAGYPESLFWDSTPRQLRTHFDAAVERSQREHRLRAWLAWHGAAFQRAKKLEPFDNLFPDRPSRAPHPGQSWQVQRNIARMLTVLYGGTVDTRISDGR